MVSLIAIVQVDKQDRIYCQAQNCKHTVYKQIHIVFDGVAFKLFGVTCFEKLYGNLLVAGHKPTYPSGSGGRRLSVEERVLLLSNTANLIEHFQRELEEKKRFRREVELRDAQESLRIQANKVHQTMSAVSQKQSRHQFSSPDELIARPDGIFEKERWNTAWQMAVKLLQQENPDQDVTAPWFSSSLRIETTRIYRALK